MDLSEGFQIEAPEVFVPSTESSGHEGLPNYGWTLGTATVRHYVFDRFGPEERVRIART